MKTHLAVGQVGAVGADWVGEVMEGWVAVAMAGSEVGASVAVEASVAHLEAALEVGVVGKVEEGADLYSMHVSLMSPGLKS